MHKAFLSLLITASGLHLTPLLISESISSSVIWRFSRLAILSALTWIVGSEWVVKAYMECVFQKGSCVDDWFPAGGTIERQNQDGADFFSWSVHQWLPSWMDSTGPSWEKEVLGTWLEFCLILMAASLLSLLPSSHEGSMFSSSCPPTMMLVPHTGCTIREPSDHGPTSETTLK